MRLPHTEHTSRPWRIHEIAHDFEVEDVWSFRTPGAGPDDFPVMLDALQVAGGLNNNPPVVRFLFAVRWKLGALFGWDEPKQGVVGRVESLCDRLPTDLRQDATGTADPNTPFTVVYELHDESASEMANKTVHTVAHLGWVHADNGAYELRMAALVKPNGMLGRLYLAAIKPIRYLIVYPALTRQWERAWRQRVGMPLPQGARTTSQAPDRGRRVSVTDPIAVTRRYDYADAFELRLQGPDRCSPEEWVRAGVDATPTWIKWIAGDADGLGSARIVESHADVVVVEDSDPLMDTVMIGRNVDPERRVLTTVLRYRRPLLARAVWAIVGILHRRTAQKVVAGRAR